MRKRILAVVLAASTFTGAGLGIAAAAPKDGQNEHGICTAYFNGQKKGHEQGASPGPFGALEEGRTLQEIFDYCSAVNGPGNGEGGDGIGGNPEENGRFTQCFTDSNDDPSDDCTDG